MSSVVPRRPRLVSRLGRTLTLPRRFAFDRGILLGQGDLFGAAISMRYGERLLTSPEHSRVSRGSRWKPTESERAADTDVHRPALHRANGCNCACSLRIPRDLDTVSWGFI